MDTFQGCKAQKRLNLLGVSIPFFLSEIFHIANATQELNTIRRGLASELLNMKGRAPCPNSRFGFIIINGPACGLKDHFSVFNLNRHIRQHHFHLGPVDDGVATLKSSLAIRKRLFESALNDPC